MKLKKILLGAICIHLFGCAAVLSPFLNSAKSDNLSSLLSLFAGQSSATNDLPGVIPGNDPENPRNGVSQMVIASSGATVRLNDEIALTIPPNSLTENTLITIDRLEITPSGEADGFVKFGRGYKFGPDGTKFASENPAVLTMKYESEQLSQMGLDSGETKLYYFDEDLKRYINVSSSVDTSAGTITGRIEHFTVYLPVAKAADLSSNPAPKALLQLPMPNNIRAGSPVYVRYTVYDKDPINNGTGYQGGAIASAKLYYRKLYPSVGAWQEAWMSPEKVYDARFPLNTTEDTYGFRIPASFWNTPIATNLGPGNDIEHYVVVTDNLGKTFTTAITGVNVTRTYTPGTLIMDSLNQPIAAGFNRTLRVRGRDNNGNYYEIPLDENEISITNQIGTTKVQPSSGTFVFTAKKRNVGNITAFMGLENISSSVTVTNGSLTRLAILDTTGNPFVGNLPIYSGTYDFDVLGYDEHDNWIQVNPTWTVDPLLGSIDSNGVLTTTNAPVIANVTAQLGSLSNSRGINLIPRYGVGGTITGLIGSVTIQNNGESLALITNGVYQFLNKLGNGVSFLASIVTQPFNQACHIDNASNVILGANRSNVDVTCYSLFSGSVESTVPFGAVTYVSTLAGLAGVNGSQNGTGASARFSAPSGITTDGRNLYVADLANDSISKIVIATGTKSTLAGLSGARGYQDGYGSSARFNAPYGLTNDGTNLYVADYGNHVIRKIVIATGEVSTFVGSPGISTPYKDGVGYNATFLNPFAITTDGTNLYVSDSNQTIRKIVIATRQVTTIAGGVGYAGFIDGVGNMARFRSVQGLATDGTNLFVVEYLNHAIRKVDIASGTVTTLAGNGSPGLVNGVANPRFNAPSGIHIQGGELYITETGNHIVRRLNLSTGNVSTLVGNGSPMVQDGSPAIANFFYPYFITGDGTSLYTTDYSGYVIRRIYQ